MRPHRRSGPHLDATLDVSADGVFAFGGHRCDRIVAAVLARVRASGVPR